MSLELIARVRSVHACKRATKCFGESSASEYVSRERERAYVPISRGWNLERRDVSLINVKNPDRKVINVAIIKTTLYAREPIGSYPRKVIFRNMGCQRKEKLAQLTYRGPR